MKEIKPRKKVSLIGTLFRSIRGIRGFEESGGSREEIVHANISGNDYYNHQIIKTALLEAEYKKAQALRQVNPLFVCALII